MRKGRISGAKKTKGRELSGHPTPLEARTFQETRRMESVDKTMRKWRAEPKLSGEPDPGVHRLTARLREVCSGFDTGSPRGNDPGMTPRRKAEPVAAKGSGKTVERAWGGWVYTITWPGGEIIDKRRGEV